MPVTDTSAAKDPPQQHSAVRQRLRHVCRAVPPRLLTLPVLLLLLLGACSHYDVGQWLHKDWMDAHIRGQGWSGAALYVALVGVVTACGVPRQICALLGGYVFGIAEGTLLVTCGTGLGCLCTFGYARFLGRNWLDKKFSSKFRTLDAFLRQSPFLLTLCIRIVPLGSNFLTNVGAGVSGLPAFPFLTGSLLGFSVQNAIFATLGSGMQVDADVRRWLGALLYAVSLALGIVVWRRWKAHSTSAGDVRQGR